MMISSSKRIGVALALALVASFALPTSGSAQTPGSGAAAEVAAAPTLTESSAPVAAATAATAPSTHTVTYDSASLKIDGHRTVIWSAEFHYWRLPSTTLWLDVLQKLKAEGYNAISVYFDWSYHSPKQGVYDFTGVRDVGKLLDMAQQVGLYVIARPGPYINAETSGGGFPAWLTQVSGKARTDAPDYLAAVDEWMTQIDGILKNHQLTNGTGTVILDQIENELATTGTAQKNYMQHLYTKVKTDGITVPVFHNDKGRNGIWVPADSGVAGTVQGPVDMYAFDGYPGGTCSSNGSAGTPSAAPDWGMWGAGGATGGSTASPTTPGFAAEFGGGWFDYWGSTGTYNCTATREGPGYERVFYDTNIANGLSIQNFYMTYGGTSWGWLPAPVVFSSYDYGAAIDEARQIRPKATTMKELGLFLQSVDVADDLAKGDSVTPSSTKVKIYHNVNPETGGQLYTAMHNPSSATTNDPFTFPITTTDGTYTVPQSGTLRVNGQDSKMLVADYDMDHQHLVYSTSEIMTHFSGANGDLALLYGRDGEDGETVLRYSSAPVVTVLSGAATSSYNAATGDLRLDYTHNGLAEVSITGGGRPALTLLLADTTTAGAFWRQDTAAGPVLERGPELVRTASVTGSTLALTGDTSAPSNLQVWAPSGVSDVTWNGTAVGVAAGVSGDLEVTAPLAGPAPVVLPDLTKATWTYAPGSPESAPSFDDSTWTTANKTTTTSTTPPPTGKPVLTADDYSYYQGDVWYRGAYTGTAGTTSISLNYGAGGAGMLQAWLDGVYLGQNVLTSGVAAPPTTGTAKFLIPANMQTGQHVLAVMVRNDGHNEDGGVNDAQKEGRGLISAVTSGAAGTIATTINWKIQGNQGGADVIDTARGANNVGGLYGERNGWYLPGYPDSTWSTVTLPQATAMPGTSWYRTTFPLDVPASEDASLGLTIGNPAVPQSKGNYRALIYVNGWNIGQYIANVGPQHTFPVPNGILNPRGNNTVALAVTSDGGAGNGVESVVLTDLGTVQGGLPLTTNDAPDWSGSAYPTATVPSQVSMDSLTSDAGATTKAGDVIHVTGTLTNRSGATASALAAVLSAPSGWTVSPSAAAPVAALDPGKSATVTWTVTAPVVTPAGSYEVVAKANFTQGGAQGTTGSTLTFPVQKAGDVYVSDMAWVSSTSGYGTIGRDVAVALAPAVGGPLTMNGKVYTKGLGMNAISNVVISVPAGCTSFTSTVGLDVGSASKGSVTFNVSGDGTTLVQTPTIATTAVPVALSVNITGVKVLTLTAGDAGNGNGHDNADWGDAQIHCAAAAAAPTVGTIAPTAGPVTGATTVKITGTGFGADSTVSVDGSGPITPTGVATDGTSLTFMTPAHDSGVVGVTVTSSGAASTAVNFTYLAGPTVTAITPNHGPTAGGTVVTLTGTGFTDGSTVSVDGSDPITPTSVSIDINSGTTTLTYSAPAHAAGAVGVTVTNPGGSSDPVGYTYDADDTTPPTVTATTNPATPSGSNGWFAGPVSVTLSATDQGSGVAKVEYQIGDGAWATYTTPITAGEGTTDYIYRATDKAGNVSSPATVTVKRDVTAPAAAASFDDQGGKADGPVAVTLSATDAGSGVDSVSYSLDGGSWTTYTAPVSVSGAGVHTVAYEAVDVAGNASEVKTAALTLLGPDTTAPVVTATTDPASPDGSAGWFTGAVSLTLAATDDRSGVASLEYQIGSGDWTAYSAPVVVPEGTTSYSYRATDGKGNQSTPGNVTIKRDATAPAVTASFDDQGGSSTGPVAVALAATDSGSGVGSLSYSLDGGVWTAYTAPVSVSGAGTHTVDYQASDVAGNDAATQTATVQISAPDTTAPVVTEVTSPAVPSGDNGWFTGAASIALTATDDRSGVTKIEYSLNGGAWTTYTAPVVVPEGVNAVDYRATDGKGNVSDPGSVTVKRDVTTPLSAASFDDQGGSATGPVSVQLVSTDAGSGVAHVFYSVSGGAQQTYTGAFTVTSTSTIVFHAVDAAGNVESAKTVTVQHAPADITAPVVTGFLTPTVPTGANGWYSSPVSLNLAATDNQSGVDSLQYRIGSGAWTGYTAPVDAPLGTSVFYWRATDGAGNVSAPGTVTVKRDDVSPVLVLASTAATATSAKISLTASDATSGIAGSVSYRVDTGAWTTYTAPFTISGAAVHTVASTVTDNAGNQTTHHDSVLVGADKTGPTVVLTQSPADPNGSLGWYTTPVTLSVAASDFSGVASVQYRIGAGAWTAYSTPVTAPAGTTAYQFRATDTKGNIAPVTASTVKYDNTVPATTATFNDLNGTSANPVSVVLRATDTLSGVGATSYQLDGAAWNTYTAAVSVSGAGNHTLAFATTDKAGNNESVKTVTVRIAGPDRTAPVLTLSTTPAAPAGANSWFTTTASVVAKAVDPTIAGSVTSGVKQIDYRIGSGAWTKYTAAVAAPVGITTYSLRVTDLSGNVSAVQSVTVKRDTAPPVPVASFTNNTKGPIPVTLTATDATSGVASITYSLDQGAFTTYTKPIAITGAGTHMVIYLATDNAGMTSNAKTAMITVKP